LVQGFTSKSHPPYTLIFSFSSNMLSHSHSFTWNHQFVFWKWRRSSAPAHSCSHFSRLL